MDTRHLPIKAIPKYRWPILNEMLFLASQSTPPEIKKRLEKELYGKLKDTFSPNDWITHALQTGYYAEDVIKRAGADFMIGITNKRLHIFPPLH